MKEIVPIEEESEEQEQYVNASSNQSLLIEHNYFEAAKDKTVLDTHFAHVSHKLVCWVRVGNDVESGDQLADLLVVNDLHAVV